MKKILASLVVFSMLFSGCSMKDEKISDEQHIVVPVIPWGFMDACENCRDGYDDKATCGRFYNEEYCLAIGKEIK